MATRYIYEIKYIVPEDNPTINSIPNEEKN